MPSDGVEGLDPIVLKPLHAAGLLCLDGLPIRGLGHDVDALEQRELLRDLRRQFQQPSLMTGLR